MEVCLTALSDLPSFNMLSKIEDPTHMQIRQIGGTLGSIKPLW